MSINQKLLPLLQQHKFDLYFNGHEHILSYVEVPYNLTFSSIYSVPPPKQPEVCLKMTEQWFGNQAQVTNKRTQGDALYQVTTGNSGRKHYDICPYRTLPCNYMYAMNSRWAWTQVRAQADSLELISQGIDSAANGPKIMYNLHISRKTATPSPSEEVVPRTTP